MYPERRQQPIFCAYDLVVNNFYNQWNRPQAGTRPGFAIVYRLSPRTGLSCYDIRRPRRRLNRTEEAGQSPAPATRRIAMLSFTADFQQFSACLFHLYDRLLSACAIDSSFDCDPAASFCGFRRRRSVCDRLFTAVRTCTVHSFVCLSLFAQQSENAWLHIQLRRRRQSSYKIQAKTAVKCQTFISDCADFVNQTISIQFRSRTLETLSHRVTLKQPSAFILFCQ